ncbi:unnamed protein product [Brachionus calyciflorus]|uniref:Uncharacterized protein n=1 Tax=Brachionus calyciflorus TaxID=104777 RepID=A0A813QZJ2_9BILA|nr:unnamed protein product [Brachionus calyciflorus]
MKPSATFQSPDLTNNSTPHNEINIILIILNALLYVVLVFINASASSPSIGIFKNVTGDISNEHQVDITPAGWTFSTWGIIYTWQGLWIVYSIASIFIRNNGNRLYLVPPVFTRLFFVFIYLHYAFNISWLFIWDNQIFSLAFAFLALLTISLYIATAISHKNIYDSETHLTKNRQTKFLWLYRIFLNNGLAFYATWVTLATFLNMAIAWTYEWHGERKIASVICLSFAALIIFTYFILDVVVLEKFLRYTYSPYLQLFIAFSGILAKNFSGKSPSAIFSLVLIIVIFLLFVAKIVLSIYRHKRDSRNRVL